MSYEYTAPNDTAAFRQGDLLKKHRAAGDTEPEPEWLFLLTADCDIAQKKAGERFTCLKIISANEFARRIWAPNAAQKASEKLARTLVEMLNSKFRKLDKNWAITERSLRTWMHESSAEQVYSGLLAGGMAPDEKLLSNLDVFKLLVSATEGGDPVCNLLKAWRKQGVDEKSIRSRLAEALAGGDGFSDYFLLPDLPGELASGFVVLLRDIRTIESKDIFVTELDSRIDGRFDGHFRIGKTVDLIRFCIVQRFAFVFSRIGLPKEFESLINVTAEVLADDLATEGN